MRRAKSQPSKTEPVPRIRDPRAIAILRAFDRFVGSPANTADEVLLDGFMMVVVDTDPGFFERLHGSRRVCWPAPAIRAVLLAFVLNAPEAALERMLDAARGQVAWLEEFEHDPTGDVRGYSLVTGEVTEPKLDRTKETA